MDHGLPSEEALGLHATTDIPPLRQARWTPWCCSACDATDVHPDVCLFFESCSGGSIASPVVAPTPTSPDCLWCGTALVEIGPRLVCPADGATFDPATYPNKEETWPTG